MNFTTKAIYFDMDGTVADLYGKQGWLESLEAEKPVFENLEPLWDMEELKNVCVALMMQGWKIGVITHLPINCTNSYGLECEEEKRVWCKKYLPFIQEFYGQRYGMDKFLAPVYPSDRMVLVDDNSLVRMKWERHRGTETIDPTKGDLIAKLKSLLN